MNTTDIQVRVDRLISAEIAQLDLLNAGLITKDEMKRHKNTVTRDALRAMGYVGHRRAWSRLVWGAQRMSVEARDYEVCRFVEQWFDVDKLPPAVVLDGPATLEKVPFDWDEGA